MIWTLSIYEICLFFESFTTNTVHPLIEPLIDISSIVGFLENFLDKSMMSWFGSTDEVCIRYIYPIPYCLVFCSHHISIFHSLHTERFCGFDDFLRILIDSCRESDIIFLESSIPRERISNERRIGMSDMRDSIGIIYRGSDVAFFYHSFCMYRGIVGKIEHFSRKNFDIWYNFHNIRSFSYIFPDSSAVEQPAVNR